LINLLCPKWYGLTLDTPPPDNGIGRKAVLLMCASDDMWCLHSRLTELCDWWDYYESFYWSDDRGKPYA